MRVWEATAEILRKAHIGSIGRGEDDLLLLVAKRVSWPDNGFRTVNRVLRALGKSQGILVKRRDFAAGGKRGVAYWLPECKPVDEQRKLFDV